MEKKEIVEKIMKSWKAGESACEAGEFRTYEMDISAHGVDGMGYFICHIPSGTKKILTWEEDCGYVLWERDVKEFVETH